MYAQMSDETKESSLLKPFNPVAEMKGLGKGIFGDPVKYQKKLREEWDKAKPKFNLYISALKKAIETKLDLYSR